MTVRVSVVVPYYEDAARLNLVLAGLAAQRFSAGFEVIVADDGSPTPAAPGQWPFPVRTVRQPDLGFRAAAARNLGAAHAEGDVLCFLDADTVPTPDYLSRLVQGCADDRTLAVGRREHADLTGWDTARLHAAFAGGPPPRLLPYPSWLAEGYRATDNLREADDASFRFVISAVLAMPRALFERVGGFDETFVGYGGEDWDLANRCWLAGADFRHVPEAVAWHDGPEAAARDDFIEVKNRETVTLSKVVTHPVVRGTGLIHEIPDVAVSLDVSGWTLGQTVVCLQSLLGAGDVGVWLTGGDSPLEEPRVHTGPVPQRVLDRCRFQVRAGEPWTLDGHCLDEPASAAPARAAAPKVARTRALARADGPVWYSPHHRAVARDVVIERRNAPTPGCAATGEADSRTRP